MNKGKLVACLEALGIEPAMSTCADRKKMQKVSYLLPIFGLYVDFNINSYSWYLHGPYSPTLAEAFFDIVENPDIPAPGRLTTEERKRIQDLRMFLGEDIESTDSLELLVSLHFLLYQAKKSGATEEEAIEFLKERKPYFKDGEIQRALRKVRSIPSLRS